MGLAEDTGCRRGSGASQAPGGSGASQAEGGSGASLPAEQDLAGDSVLDLAEESGSRDGDCSCSGRQMGEKKKLTETTNTLGIHVQERD